MWFYLLCISIITGIQVVKIICLKLHETEKDITFNVTCVLSFVVSAYTDRDKRQRWRCRSPAVFIKGSRLSVAYAIVSPGKCHSTGVRRGSLSSNRFTEKHSTGTEKGISFSFSF